MRYRTELEPIIEAKLAELGRTEALRRLIDAGIPTGEVNDLRALIDHPQHRARGRWTDASSPHGPVRVLRSPLQLDGTREPIGAVPGLGEHTQAVLTELEDDEVPVR